MRVSLKALSCLAVATAASFSSADTILRQKTLADLSKAASTSTFARKNCDFVSTSTDSSGSPVATLKFRGTYASFGQDLSTGQDWSGYNMVEAYVTNKETHTVNFKYILQLTSDSNSYTGAYTGGFSLNAGESKRFIFTINPDSAKPYGMEYLRPVLSAPYTEIFAGSSFRSLKSIHHWRFSNQDSTNATISISQLKLIKQNLVFDDMVDGYGQYTDRTWSSKVAKDSDFATRKTAELNDLSTNPGTGETTGSKYLASPVKGNGSWQVVRNSTGQMYMEHPNGKLFWSLGVSGISEGQPTPVEGRENDYTYLPSTTGTYASAYYNYHTPDGSAKCFNFAQKNLMTKYGSNYSSGWEAQVYKRLTSWGINTVGINSNTDFFNGAVPYTVLESTSNFGTRLKTPHMLWGSLPDPYASSFQTYMTTKFTADLAPYVLHQNFMGVYVDNEMSWGNTDSTDLLYNVPRGVLNSSSSQPAKSAFMKQLQSSYSSIGSLNTAWKTSFSSWTSFLSSQWLPKSYTTAMKADFSKFTNAFASQYYSKVNAALVAAKLKGLYLGSRFDDYTPEVISAASKYVDVLSFNAYRTVNNLDWNYFNSLSRPVLFSEIGYGTKADGTFGGPSPTFSVQDRASNLKAFLNKAITCKNVVGVCWYSYLDQPITGRATDYENTGMGLVDVADNPYTDTIKVLRDFTKKMYATRS
jgi:hypothetical protein